MITKIEVTNYRTCLKTVFSPHPQLSVLIGPNGSGKTNLLHAIALLKQLANETRFPHVTRDIPTVKSRIAITCSLPVGDVRFVADIKTYTDENNRDVIVDSRQSWYLPGITQARRPLLIPLVALVAARDLREHKQTYLFRNGFGYIPFHEVTLSPAKRKQAFPALRAIATFLAHTQYYGASQFTNPASCGVSFEIEEGNRLQRPRATGHAVFMGDLYVQYKRPENPEYRQFLELVGPSGLHLLDAIAFKEIPTSSIDYSVQAGGGVGERKRTKVLIVPQLTIGRQTLSPNQLSEGTFRTLALIFYLTTHASTLLLLEEPEVCVHHGLLASILQVIKAHTRDKQIVVSSHSELVLDQVKPENVFRVSFQQDKGTEVHSIAQSLPRPALDALKDYLRTEGNLGEYWRSGGLD